MNRTNLPNRGIPRRTGRLAAAAAAAMLLTLGGPASASSTSPSASEVKQEVKDAMATIADYTAAQRDQAAARAREALVQMDVRLAEAKQNLDTHLGSMDALAAQKARLEMARLRGQRDRLDKWFDDIEHGTAKTWDQVTGRFTRNYQSLSDALVDARKDF